MKNIRNMAMIGILSAISLVLMLFDFPLPIFPSFLKIDLSDMPALLAAFSMGPLYGVLVALIKNLLYIPMSSTGGVGPLANFIVGAAFVLPAGFFYRANKTKKGAALGLVCGILLMGVAGALANRFIIIPFYITVMGIPLEAIIKMSAAIFPQVETLFDVIIYSIVPFNIFKGVVISLITLLSYKKLSPLIKFKR